MNKQLLSRRKNKKNILLFFIFFVPSLLWYSAQAQTGPAGVNANIQLWLDANDSATLFQNTGGTTPATADGDLVRRWGDKSGVGNHAILISGQTPATIEKDASNLINGNPVVNFKRVDDTNGSPFEIPLDIRATTSTETTIFTVYRTTTTTLTGSGSVGHAIWGNDNNDWDRFFYTYWGLNNFGDTIDDGLISLGGTSQGLVVDDAGKVGEIRLLTSVFDHNVVNGSAIYFDGNLIQTFRDQSDVSDALDKFYIGWDGDSGAYEGDLAEIIVYNRKLTACEIETINNYLGTKYGKDFNNIADNYNLPTPYNENVNGIGSFSTTCATPSLQESGVIGALTVSNGQNINTVAAPSFMTFGNKNAGLGVSTQVPSGYSTRIAEEWRVDEDGDDIGTVTLTFDLGSIDIAPGTDVSNFALLVDTDNDFTNANIITVGRTVDVANNTITFSGVDLADESYFTMATSTSEVSIASTASAAEGDAISFAVSSNNNVSGDVVVAYSFSNGNRNR